MELWTTLYLNKQQGYFLITSLMCEINRTKLKSSFYNGAVTYGGILIKTLSYSFERTLF